MGGFATAAEEERGGKGPRSDAEPVGRRKAAHYPDLPRRHASGRGARRQGHSETRAIESAGKRRALPIFPRKSERNGAGRSPREWSDEAARGKRRAAPIFPRRNASGTERGAGAPASGASEGVPGKRRAAPNIPPQKRRAERSGAQGPPRVERARGSGGSGAQRRYSPGERSNGATGRCWPASIATRSIACARKSSRSPSRTSCVSCSRGSTSSRPTRLTGLDGLREVLGGLDGFELAAGAWERTVLPARIDGYEPSMLDMLCLSGEIAWMRLSAPTGDSRPPLLVPATPIALFLREHRDAWHVEPGRRSAPGAHAGGPARARGSARARRLVPAGHRVGLRTRHGRAAAGDRGARRQRAGGLGWLLRLAQPADDRAAGHRARARPIHRPVDSDTGAGGRPGTGKSWCRRKPGHCCGATASCSGD